MPRTQGKKKPVAKKLTTTKPVSKKKPKLKSKPISKSTLLKSPHASLTFTNFATLYTSITVQANIDSGKITEIGFACEDEKLRHYVQSIGEKLIKKTPAEVEQISLESIMADLSPPKEERLLLEYAFSAWQDVIARLPTPDPLSGALQTLRHYNREFPRGTLLPDLED